MTGGVPHRAVLGPVLFNVFVGDVHGGIVGTLSESVGDPELCGAIDTSEGRAATQGCPGSRGHELALRAGSPAPNGPLGCIESGVAAGRGKGSSPSAHPREAPPGGAPAPEGRGAAGAGPEEAAGCWEAGAAPLRGQPGAGGVRPGEEKGPRLAGPRGDL